MTREDMQLSVHDAIKNAIMTRKPLVIVEGKDDLPIYVKLTKQINNNFNVKPIEYFKECVSGCYEIETKIEEINSLYSSNHTIYNMFIGIVDRDTREFRNTFKNLNGILYLDTYSFENSYVTKETLLNVVEHLTSVTENELNNNLSDTIINKINESSSTFYFTTLEALKNSVEVGYSGLLGFSDNYNKVLMNPNLLDELNNKKIYLEEFARYNNITNTCILTMHRFCKGKWHLSYFVNAICKHTKDIHNYCGDSCHLKKT